MGKYDNWEIEKKRKSLPDGYEIIFSGEVKEGDLIWTRTGGEWSKPSDFMIDADISNDTYGTARKK